MIWSFTCGNQDVSSEKLYLNCDLMTKNGSLAGRKLILGEAEDGCQHVRDPREDPTRVGQCVPRLTGAAQGSRRIRREE